MDHEGFTEQADRSEHSDVIGEQSSRQRNV
jgi:hypothetical protein